MLRVERRGDVECYNCEDTTRVRELVVIHENRRKFLCAECLISLADYRNAPRPWVDRYVAVAMLMLRRRRCVSDPRQLWLEGV